MENIQHISLKCSVLMQMLQSDWLSHCTLSAISVQCFGVVDNCIKCFLVSSNFEGTFFKQMDNQIYEKT